MIELLDFIAERLDPSDPVHAEARGWVKRCRELHNRREELDALAMLLLDADDIEGSEAAVAKSVAVSNELKEVCAHQRSVLGALRTSAETLQ